MPFYRGISSLKRHTNSIALVLCLSLSLNLPPAYLTAAIELPPIFSKADEKLGYLLWVESEIPWLFQEGAEYDINFFSLINRQNKLVKTLSNDDTYMDIAEIRPNRVDIIIQVLFDKEEKSYVLSEPSLKSIERLISKGNTDLKSTLHNLKTAIAHYTDNNSKGILTGLIKALPKEKQTEVFRMDKFSQIRFLSSEGNLSKKEVSKLFNFDAYPITQEKERNKEHLIKLLNNVFDLEKIIAELTYIFSHQSLQVKGGMSNETSTKVIKAVKPSLKEVGLGTKEQSTTINLFNQYLKQNSRIQKISHDAILEELTLKEVPPYLGIFRGICGSDCSTSFSFPYVYATHERTFFIYDTRKKLKGYLQATEITADEKKVLYIHDISGSRLSVQSVKNIISGIQQGKERLGYEAIALPTS